MKSSEITTKDVDLSIKSELFLSSDMGYKGQITYVRCILYIYIYI